ncbi:MAG: hypothetical protein WAO55_03225, partial [Candidatus Manganitrophaceae bacterium]
PEIRHNPPGQAVSPGKPVVIEAVMTDNVAITEATLFYRLEGQADYSSINMEPIGKDRYAATIAQGEVTPPGIEYYIQALDRAGNVATRGFSFSPLTLTVLSPPPEKKPEKKEGEALTEKLFPPEAKEPAQATEAPPEPAWYKKWWVWTIAGAVIIGAVAASSGGGGGGGGPTTGSATITGPVP